MAVLEPTTVLGNVKGTLGFVYRQVRVPEGTAEGAEEPNIEEKPFFTKLENFLPMDGASLGASCWRRVKSDHHHRRDQFYRLIC